MTSGGPECKARQERVSEQWLPATLVERTQDGKAVVRIEGLESGERGDTFLVRIRRARNPKHHRLYWAMIRLTVDATDRWPSPQALHNWVKYELGLYTLTAVDQHKVIVEWDSTNFMSMDQDAFKDFFERAVAAIVLETGIDPLDFDRELRNETRDV